MYFTSLVINAQPPSLQDGGDSLRNSPSGKFVIEVCRAGGALIDLTRCPNEPLEADVAVAGLATVAALAVGHVADVERVEGHQAVRLVRGQSVAPVALRVVRDLSRAVFREGRDVYLISSHLPPGHQTEEPLLGVNISPGRRPAGRVDGVAQRAVLEVLPLRQEGDRVLAGPPQHLLRHHPGAGPAHHADTASHALHGPDVEVDVVAVEVVRDVAPQPGLHQG